MLRKRPGFKPLYRRYHRTGRNDYTCAFLNRAVVSPVFSFFLTMVAAFAVFMTALALFESKIQPLIITIAEANARNTVVSVLERTLVRDITTSEVCYNELVTVQRDEAGQITALTSDMAAMNRLRSRMVTSALDSLGSIRTSDLSIPVGNLIHSGLLWGHGPRIQVRSMSIGTISAEFRSQFTSAGVNQTLHRICLDLCVPITILLPGKTISVSVPYELCVAETVIVGRVPTSFLYRG